MGNAWSTEMELTEVDMIVILILYTYECWT